MANAAQGWGISGSNILVTTDGGQTWNEVTPPQPFPPGINISVFGGFPDSQTAWVIFSLQNISQEYVTSGSVILPGTSVWHTMNGGRTWKASMPLMHELYGDCEVKFTTWAEFATLNPQTGWLMVRGWYIGAGNHTRAQLFGTTDSGATWIPIIINPNWEISPNDFTGMALADPGTGWLTFQTVGPVDPNPPHYLETGDGGLIWEQHELPPVAEDPELFKQYLACEPHQPNLPAAKLGRLLVVCSGGTRPDVGYLYATENGGATWQAYPLPAAPEGDTLLFFDAANGLLLGRDMYRTTDGGQSWQHFKTVAWDAQFSFVDRLNGWAIASQGESNALVHTTDGGETWREIKPVVAP